MNHYRETMAFMNRRGVLGAMAGFAAGAAAELPNEALFRRDPEQYWLQLRASQFLLPDWRIFLNNGSLGVAPQPVVRAVEAYERAGASRIGDEYPRWGYETLDAHRTEMAAYVGCSKEELAFTHNATEALSIIADGLDLRAGDEVLITDQEHPSGRAPWMKKQARYGVTVREVKIPAPPQSSPDVAERIVSAIGPRTRVVSFSGITTTTGLIMPVREICDAARAKGVISVVDGAHITGQIPFRIDEAGCDFFAGSPHKWLFAPPGCGLLYIREEMLDKLWPGTVTGRWDDKSLKAARFMQVGTNNRALFEGMLAGLRFHQALGSERVYSRIHALARRVYDQAARRPHVLEMLSPADDRLYGSLVTFRLKPADTSRFWAEAKRRRMWVMQHKDLRVSAHVHTRTSDIDALFATIDDVFGRG